MAFMHTQQTSEETLPLANSYDIGSLSLVSFDIINKQSMEQESDGTYTYPNTAFYNKDIISNLNESRQKKLVFGFLRYNYTHRINSHSIPTLLIFNYFNNINDIYPAKYLSKSLYFTNSIHIDSYSIGSNQIAKGLWPTNLISNHNNLIKHKFRPMLSYLMLSLILIILSTILFILDDQGVAIAAMLGFVIVIPCTFVSIWIFYKTYIRQYILLNFNCSAQAIQKWIYKTDKIKTKTNTNYVCQIIAIQNICKFRELNKICFERPFVVTHKDSNGNRSKYYHDGCITFVTCNGRSVSVVVSYQSEWMQMYATVKDIMNGINPHWFQSIEWDEPL